MDVSAIWDEEATAEQTVEAYQHLIDNGQAWLLEGHVGRTAMDLIQAGQCMLGEQAHTDYWGNRVPSRHEVEPGTPGSAQYVAEQRLGELEERNDRLADPRWAERSSDEAE